MAYGSRLLAALVQSFLHYIGFIGSFLFGGFRRCISFRWHPGRLFSGPAFRYRFHPQSIGGRLYAV